MTDTAPAPTPAEAALSHMIEGRDGVLSTRATGAEVDGYPFGSVVPYALTARGEPVILVARIAQHTRNLEADPRASLTVRDREVAGDAQASWRVTVVADACRLVAEETGRDGPEDVVGAEALAELHARYLERVPGADQYLETHGFDYWVLRPARVRLIEGFGRIRWVAADEYRLAPEFGGLDEAAAGILQHMNDDHADALVEICGGLRGHPCQAARMVGLDPLGFQVRTEGPDALLHLSFDRPLQAAAARHVFVDLVRRARAAAKDVQP